ncbi:hypothetical protein DDR33_17055 [Pararcticibacter amylolyticus]|uniref:Uncharacterized protein n=1 Tax=Pararcticibacter amylolyticus TaxID=2173175 RepID=A0A2U2PDS7_9SPHI|nr:hypothetical protein DDR33_17055 [Pararcticibacter amylolyticus]
MIDQLVRQLTEVFRGRDFLKKRSFCNRLQEGAAGTTGNYSQRPGMLISSDTLQHNDEQCAGQIK